MGPFGSVGHDPHRAGVLVGGDPLLGELDDVLGGGGGALAQRDRGAHLLAHQLVRHPDHGDLDDVGVGVDDLLDLARVHVHAAAQDHVLLAVDDREVALVVHGREVAGAEPAVGDGLGGRLGLAPVALHHVVAADRDLADLADRHLVAVEVDALHLAAGDGDADGAGLALAVGHVEARDGAGLGQAVALEDDAAELVLEGPHDLERHRGPARGADAQRRGVHAVGLRVVEDRGVHRRHALHDRDPLLLDDLDGRGGVEAGDEGEARAGDRRGVEADDQAEDVEERQAAHDDVVGGDLLDRRARAQWR